MNRDLLYNLDMSDEESVIRMSGIQMAEDLHKGQYLSIEKFNAIYDADINLPVFPSLYKITEANNGILEIEDYVSHSKYSIYEEDAESLLEEGYCVIQENIEACSSFLFEDGQPGRSGLPTGYIKAIKSFNQPAYNYMTNTLFKKGYLQKFRDGEGKTSVKYRKRAFPKFASGNPNPEWNTNMQRSKRRRWREKHNEE